MRQEHHSMRQAHVPGCSMLEALGFIPRGAWACLSGAETPFFSAFLGVCFYVSSLTL